MNLQRPPRTTPKEMTKFHTDDYVNFLRTVTPDNMNEYSKQLTRCKFSHCLKKQNRKCRRARDESDIFEFIQLTSERTVLYMMACSNFAKSQREVLLVST